MHESQQISVNDNRINSITEDLKDFDRINLVARALYRHHTSYF